LGCGGPGAAARLFSLAMPGSTSAEDAGAASKPVFKKLRRARSPWASDLDVAGTRGGFLRFNILSSGIQDQEPVPGDEGIPTIRNFRFSNVRVADCLILVEHRQRDRQRTRRRQHH
jgi:hypothetical protein